MTEPVDPSRNVTVPLDGGAMDLKVWLPTSGRGPGLILVQEIFGVGEWMATVATELAAEGFVVAAPDLYWRLEPGWTSTHDSEGMGAALAMVQRLDVAAAVADTVAALDALADLDEVTGAPGVIGYCLGGTIAWMAAALGDPSVCVSYYGSGVPDAVDRVEAVSCPTLLHFGGADDFIPVADVDRVQSAVAGVERIELHVHEGGGHAFENDRSGFHQPEVAARSRALTLAFLHHHLS